MHGRRGHIVIRQAGAGDWRQVAALRMELAAAEGTEVQVSAAEVARLLTQPGAEALVAELDDRVAGLLTYFVYPSLMRDARWAQIAEVVVHAPFRRRGVGRALLDDAVRRFTELGLRDACVATLPHNAAAAALYRSAGFVHETVTLERHIGEVEP
jgi:ribosomal protein S18 acetylase RimI-like enzyme